MTAETRVDAPSLLRLEHLHDAVLGLGVACPRLSWVLPVRAKEQLAYRIEADGWDSGRVESDRTVFVAWGGEPVPSQRRVGWRVKVWTDAGESTWSSPAWFEPPLHRSYLKPRLVVEPEHRSATERVPPAVLKEQVPFPIL